MLKSLEGGKAVKKKITLANKKLLLCIRFKDVPRILEGMFPEITMEYAVIVVFKKVDEALPAEETGGLLSDAGDFRKMTKGFEGMGFCQSLCIFVPRGFP